MIITKFFKYALLGLKKKDTVGGNKGELDEDSQKVQTSSYMINKSWGCSVQHGDYS